MAQPENSTLSDQLHYILFWQFNCDRLYFLATANSEMPSILKDMPPRLPILKAIDIWVNRRLGIK